MTEKINDLQEDFAEEESEIETGARDSIAATVEEILKYFEINIDTETALGRREW